MAQFTVNVPDAAVPDLVKAVAQAMDVAPPSGGAAQASLGEAFCLRQLWQVYERYKSAQASEAERVRLNQPANKWAGVP